jgi:hypothetical protein
MHYNQSWKVTQPAWAPSPLRTQRSDLTLALRTHILPFTEHRITVNTNQLYSLSFEKPILSSGCLRIQRTCLRESRAQENTGAPTQAGRSSNPSPFSQNPDPQQLDVFLHSMGAQIPLIAEKPLAAFGCRKFRIDTLGDVVYN